MSTLTITIGVPSGRREAVEQFLREEGIDWTLAEAGHGWLNILEADEPGRPCDRRTLHVKGRIDCSTALALADETRVASRSVGRLMNLLEIRIGNCQLGCFQ